MERRLLQYLKAEEEEKKMTALTLRAKMFADMAKGGYFRTYAILDGDKVIGEKVVSAATRNATPTVIYWLLSKEDSDGPLASSFHNPEDFRAAYERAKND